MDPPTSPPPKRVTRARTAGKASTATAGTASSAARKTATVATKTKTTTRTAAGPASSSSTAAAPSTRTSTKRKTRPDDHEDDSEAEAPAKLPPVASRTAARATRGPGRPKKIIDSKPTPTSAPAAPRAARGRPPKKPLTQPVKEEPQKSTRTRAKRAKVDHDDDADDLAPDSVKKPTRGRPVGSTSSTRAPASKPVKTVTFAEPDKENVLPLTGSKAKTLATKPADTTTAGMRAKPVRKPVAAGRATKSTAPKIAKTNTKKTDDKASKPLGPKKVTQLSAMRDQDVESEDELAMDRTPARPLNRGPVKPPVGIKPPVETKEESPPADEDTTALPPPESTVILGSPVRRPPPSPFKDSMKSPAKRIEGLQLGFSAIQEPFQKGASPSKAPLIQSPAKRCPVSIKPVDLGPSIRHDQNSASPFKQSLFQSPARRLFSPKKSAKLPEPELESETVDFDVDVDESPAPKRVSPSASTQAASAEESEESEASDAEIEPAMEDEAKDDEDPANPSTAELTGQVSAVLPLEADSTPAHDTSLVNQYMEEEDEHDTVVLEEDYDQVDVIEDGQAFGMFGLREKDQFPFDKSYSESEGEPTRVMTPQFTSPVKHVKGSARKPRTSGFGFTPLAQRLDSWQARSPVKNEARTTTPEAENSAGSGEAAAVSQDSPMKDGFFEDEMAWPDAPVDDSGNESGPLSEIPEIKEPILEDISLTEEDFDLVAEANGMSVMSPEQVDSMHSHDRNEDSMSEASQEYGDENEVPDENARVGTPIPPVTPQRYTTREFHTVSKIPLKAPDESTPPPQPSLKKRRHSISRLPETRPTHGLTRSATVISYSPSHKKQSETWSEAGSSPTPMQSPQRQADPTLLRGAVVFVDVHTMEGADASAIFVELLAQMGARCVKHWTWNPNDEDASSKIGITHVVYKDGGKRTMERVRETGGVVQCVGVGWVLDCERQNAWLDEAPYYIDTSLTPRGGARRRKSMEPKVVANVNGTVVSDPPARRTSPRESQGAPSTPAPANRRDNAGAGGHPPLRHGDDAGHELQLVQRTCPPKPQHMYHDLGVGVLGRDKDENVARRLMDARRKSLAVDAMMIWFPLLLPAVACFLPRIVLLAAAAGSPPPSAQKPLVDDNDLDYSQREGATSSNDDDKPPPTTSQWTLNFTSPAPHLFASVPSLLHQWSNTIFPNGHALAAVEIPAYTLLHHGLISPEDPNPEPPSPEWLAFDPEMSYGIMGSSRDSFLLTYQAARPVRALYFDGESAALMGLGQMDTQMLQLFGNVSGPPGGGGFFMGLGIEYARAHGLCRDSEPSHPAPPPNWRRDVGREPFLKTQGWGWFDSATWHYGSTRNGPGQGEVRARVLGCGVLSYYSPRFANQSLNRARARAVKQLARRRRFHHLGDVVPEEALLMRKDTERALRGLVEPGSTGGNCSGADWVLMTSEITAVYDWLFDLRGQSHLFMVGYLEYPTDSMNHDTWSTESTLYDETYSRCRYRYTRLLVPEERRAPLSPEEEDIRLAVEEVYGTICSVLLTMGFAIEQAWLELTGDSRRGRPGGSPHRHGTALARRAVTWRDRITELTAWLGWESEYYGCKEMCAWDERCYIPMWPLLAHGGPGPGKGRGGGHGPPPPRDGPGGKPGGGYYAPYAVDDHQPPPHPPPPNHNGTGPGRPGFKMPPRGPWWMGDDTDLFEPKCVNINYIMGQR
ncbi:hypothetical protein VMCG_08340 [Cytospora schulzeri]|uniref:BRCT domain-containing protein n=1 Tax=Cytospora schulzeri TaxID=448051 RepID=A0A423VVG7_9PEZI|nr:hypothetical protein VMCG_08340 [Valsa malicola]